MLSFSLGSNGVDTLEKPEKSANFFLLLIILLFNALENYIKKEIDAGIPDAPTVSKCVCIFSHSYSIELWCVHFLCLLFVLLSNVNTFDKSWQNKSNEHSSCSWELCVHINFLSLSSARTFSIVAFFLLLLSFLYKDYKLLCFLSFFYIKTTLCSKTKWVKVNFLPAFQLLWMFFFWLFNNIWRVMLMDFFHWKKNPKTRKTLMKHINLWNQHKQKMKWKCLFKMNFSFSLFFYFFWQFFDEKKIEAQNLWSWNGTWIQNMFRS